MCVPQRLKSTFLEFLGRHSLMTGLIIWNSILGVMFFPFVLIFSIFQLLVWKGLRSFSFLSVPSQFLPSSFPVPSQFLPSSFPVPSQFHPSYFPKLIRAKVHGGNPEGQLHWSKMSFLKSILKQNAVYQSNFQMSRQCLQRSDIFYLTLQRFTVSTYIGGGLQSEDFQTFFIQFLNKLTHGACPMGTQAYPRVPSGYPIDITLLFLIQFSKSQVLLSPLMKSNNLKKRLNYWAVSLHRYSWRNSTVCTWK